MASTSKDAYRGDQFEKGKNCALCRNHNLIEKRRHRGCIFAECTCIKCTATRAIRNHAARYSKKKNSLVKIEEGDAAEEKGKYGCKLCRNHEVYSGGKHYNCPFGACVCEKCAAVKEVRAVHKAYKSVRKLTRRKRKDASDATLVHPLNYSNPLSNPYYNSATPILPTINNPYTAASASATAAKEDSTEAAVAAPYPHGNAYTRLEALHAMYPDTTTLGEVIAKQEEWILNDFRQEVKQWT